MGRFSEFLKAKKLLEDGPAVMPQPAIPAQQPGQNQNTSVWKDIWMRALPAEKQTIANSFSKSVDPTFKNLYKFLYSGVTAPTGVGPNQASAAPGTNMGALGS